MTRIWQWQGAAQAEPPCCKRADRATGLRASARCMGRAGERASTPGETDLCSLTPRRRAERPWL